MQLQLQLRAWYIDRFGMERECIAVTMNGLATGVLMALDLDGQPLDIEPGDLYYVPQHASDDA